MDRNILSDLVITNVYSATTMYSEQNTKNKRLHRENWAIVIKQEGETQYCFKGKTIISNLNHIVLLPGGCSYEWWCTRSGHFSVIAFECNKKCDEIFCFSVKNSTKVLRLFQSLEYKRTLKNPMYIAESIRDTYTILLMLVSAEPKRYLPSDKLGKIRPALDYIATNYSKEMKNDDLARIAGLSTIYFRKLFTEVLGTSPISYVHELRIKKAQEMLKSDYGSITNIAETLGYLNVYDFSRVFKRLTGIPPSKYGLEAAKK